MSLKEITVGALSIRHHAETDADALSDAYEAGVLDDGDEGSIADVDDVPVGAEGTDPEEPEPDPRGPNPVPR